MGYIMGLIHDIIIKYIAPTYYPVSKYIDNMNNQTIEMAIRFSDMLKEGNAYTKAQKFMKVRLLAKKLSTADVRNCNGEYISEDDYYKALGKIEHDLAEALPNYIFYYHQTDPRGASLYVSTERMTDIDYNAKGQPIY
jgi:hypothetical protein